MIVFLPFHLSSLFLFLFVADFLQSGKHEVGWFGLLHVILLTIFDINHVMS